MNGAFDDNTVAIIGERKMKSRSLSTTAPPERFYKDMFGIDVT